MTTPKSDECRFDDSGGCYMHGVQVYTGVKPKPALCTHAAAALRALADEAEEYDYRRYRGDTGDVIAVLQARVRELEWLEWQVANLPSWSMHKMAVEMAEDAEHRLTQAQGRVQELEEQLHNNAALHDYETARAEARLGRLREAGIELLGAVDEVCIADTTPSTEEKRYEAAIDAFRAALTEAIEPIEELHDWRAEATRLAVQVEDLEHEVSMLQEKLRRIKGYVNSALTGLPSEKVGGSNGGE